MALSSYGKKLREAKLAEEQKTSERQYEIKKERVLDHYAQANANAEVARENSIKGIANPNPYKQHTTEVSRNATSAVNAERQKAVDYLNGLSTYEKKSLAPYENKAPEQEIQQAQVLSDYFSKEREKIAKEMADIRGRLYAKGGSGITDEEKDRYDALDKRYSYVSKELDNYNKVLGISRGQRVQNALTGIVGTAVSAPAVIGQTMKTAWDDAFERLRDEELQKRLTEQRIRESQLGMEANFGYANHGDAMRDTDYLERLAELEQFKRTNEVMNPHTALDMNTDAMQNMANAMTYTQQATAGLEGEKKILADSAISVAENMMYYPTAVINPALPLALMGARASASRMYELGNRGLGAGEILSRGLASGVIEAATEKMSFEKVADLVLKGGKGFVKNMLKQAGVEATEEGISYFMNYVFDNAYKDPTAKFDRGEFLESVVAGGLSGAFFGLGGSMTNSVYNVLREGKANEIGNMYQQNDVVDDIIASALESAEDTEAYKLATELQSRREAGHEIADREIGNLVFETEKAIEAEEKATREADFTEALKNYGDSGAKAFGKFYDHKSNVHRFNAGFSRYYDSGLSNVPFEKIETMYENTISPEVRLAAYNAGVNDARASLTKEIENKKVFTDNRGLIENEFSADVPASTKSMLDRMGKNLGVPIKFVDKIVAGYDKDGNEITANGMYVNGEVNIAKDSVDPYMTVARHEITHHFQQAAPKEYRAFRDYAVQVMMGVNENIVNQYKRKYALEKDSVASEYAMDEIAAEFTEQILTDENKLNDFISEASGTKEGRTMLQKFFDSVKAFIKKVKSAFKGNKAKMDEAAKNEFGVTLEALERATQLYSEAYSATSKAVADARAKGITSEVDADGTTVLTKADGTPVAMIQEDGNAKFSIKTYRESGRAELVKWLNSRVKSNQIARFDADDIIKKMDEYYDLCMTFKDKYATFGKWSEANVIVDEKGKPVFSVVKKNGEYPMNLDYSLVCKKRRALDAVYSEMIKRGIMDKVVLNEANIAKINDIIRSYDLETACSLCYVDAKRFRQANVADHFVEQYNSTVNMILPKGTNIKAHHFDFIGTGNYTDAGVGLHTLSNNEVAEGVAALKQIMKDNGFRTVPYKIAKHLLENPQDRKLVTRSEFMNTDGFGALKVKNPDVLSLYNSSKGSGGPKASFSDVQYLGEILKKNNFTPAKAYAVGGVRIQSFSDYIAYLVFDYIQMVGDLSAKKLPAHAYSKEELFALQFGLTGIKINMSLVPAVVEGGIAAGLDANGNYAWHDGQSFGSVVGVVGSAEKGFKIAIEIQNADGYTKNCGTIAVGVSDEHIKKMLLDDNIRMIIPYHKSSLNPIVAAMNNIDKYKNYEDVQNTRYKTGTKIEEKEFPFNEALRKRKGDAKAAANDYLLWCERNNYIPKFDEFTKDPKYRENYYKLLIDFACYDKDGNVAPQGAVTMTFPTESDAFGSMTELIERGLSEEDILEGKRALNVPKIVDEIERTFERRYYSLKDSSGRQLTKEQAEALKDSKIRDENGNPLVVYGSNDNALKGTYYTNKSRAKDELGGNVVETYLNITNPLDLRNLTAKSQKKIEGELYKTKAFKEYATGVWGDYENDWDVSFLYYHLDKYYLAVKELGYDGVITARGNIIEAFNPKQAELFARNPSARNKIMVDSEGNSITSEQAKYFEKSKVRDENGKLLVMYHGTAYAGFTEFDTSKGRYNGSWFTTSKKDADSYAGNYRGKLFDPNEKESSEMVSSGDYKISSDMRFDTEADRAEFIKENPNAKKYRSDDEIEALMRNATKERDWDAYDELEEELNSKDRKEIKRAYTRYEWEHSQTVTIGEMLDNPEGYTTNDLLRAWDAYDSNNVAYDSVLEGATVDDLIDGLRNAVEEYPEVRDIPFKARIQVGKSGKVNTQTNNRTYACYLNVTNPVVINAHGAVMAQNGLYSRVESAMQDDKHDGVIIRDVRVGAYGENGDVVIVKTPEQIKLTSNKKPTSNPDIRYSLKDTDYMKAVESGDMETAQKMVDEAAKAAGYDIKAWHGSRYIFNEFSKEKRGSNTHTKSSERWFFAGDKDSATSYYPYGVMKELARTTPNVWKESDAENMKQKGKLYELYLRMENPLVADVAGYDYAAHALSKDALMEYVEQAELNGNDGIILYHVRDNQLRPHAEESTVYMFRESDQAKSADPVTYDANGNVIPLSERFNDKQKDIRYSLKNGEGGYDGHSMSNRARRAYENGEMPLSKWNKKTFLEEVGMLVDEDVLSAVSSLTVEEMRTYLLKRTSWHHTGTFYNETDFYSLDEAYIESLTVEDVNEIKQSRVAKKKRNPEEVAAEKEQKLFNKKVNAEYDRWYGLFENQKHYKTFGGFVKWAAQQDSSVLTEMENSIIEAEIEKTREKIEVWRKLPADHRRQKDVEAFDNDAVAYVKERLFKNDAPKRRDVRNEISKYLKANEGQPRFSLKNTEHISSEMTDEQRHDLLKDKNIIVPTYNKKQIDSIDIEEFSRLNGSKKREVYKILRKIGEEFGVFKDYANKDIDVEFGFSKSNMRESVYWQDGEYENYAKMLSSFDDVIKNAIGIEIHKNRYETAGDNIEETFVLVSAVADEENIIPVLLEVRTFTDGTKSVLYVTASFSAIEKSRIFAYNSNSNPAEAPYTLPAFSLRLADIFKNVKVADKRLVKYIPDGFLDEEQRTAKKEAIAEEKERTDKKNNNSKFSLKGTSDILKENAKLKKQVDYLKGQMKLTKGFVASDKTVSAIATNLLKDYDSTLKATDIKAALKTLYNGIGNEMSWNDIKLQAMDIARDIVSNAVTINDEQYEAYNELKNYLRNTAITIAEEDRKSLTDGYNDFKKSNRGKLKLTNDGTKVDMVYQSLAEHFPEYFDSESITNPAEQLEDIVRVLDELSAYEENPYSSDIEGAAEWVANDIIGRAVEVQRERKTFADRQKDKREESIAKQTEKAEKRLEKRLEKQGKELEDAALAELMHEGAISAKEIRKQNEEIANIKADATRRVEKLRKQKNDRIDRIKKRQKAKEAKMSESRKAKVLRSKILRHIAPMKKKLLAPTDNQHITKELRTTVAAVLEAINTESKFSINAETGKVMRNDSGLPTKRTEAFMKLKEELERIRKEEGDLIVLDPSLLGVEADGISSKMVRLIGELSNIRIDDMNSEQLTVVWEVLRAVEHSISTANKMFASKRFASVVDMAYAFAEDSSKMKPLRSRTREHFAIDLQNPYTYFSHYGQAGLDFYRMLRDAQDNEQTLQDELAERVGKVVSLETRQKLEKELVEFETGGKDKLTLSKAHIMELYLLYQRPHARQHLLYGGIHQPEINNKIRRSSEVTMMTAEDFASLFDKLTDAEKKLADDLQKLTLFLAEKGNEASMQVFGYEKFNDPNYWTIKVSSEGIYQDTGKTQDTARSVKNMGSAKALEEEAKNPLDVNGIFKTFDAHASDMICYSAWLAPMEDANRLFNFRYRNSEGKPTGKNFVSVLRTYGGERAEGYWKNLMKDIQNGISGEADDSFSKAINKTIGNVKKASIAGNIRVVAQQPTAWFRAGVVLSADNMAKGITGGVTKGNGWKKAVKYAPIAARKKAGGFEISASPAQLGEVLYSAETRKGKAIQLAKDLPLASAAKADAITWGAIWNACEYQVRDANKNVAVGSEAFYEAVAELFTDVIDQTQVVDGVLQRSQIMRSSNALNKQATAFMGEPTLALNLVMRSYDKVRRSEGKARSEAIRQMGRTIFSLILSNVAVAFMQSAVDALRDDDDEKEYFERLKTAFLGITGDEKSAFAMAYNFVLAGNLGSASNPVAWIPYVKDTLSILEGYTVERLDASAISDFITASTNTIKSLSGEGKWTTGYATLKMLTTGGKLFGSSASNIMRDVESIYRVIASSNTEMEYGLQKKLYNMATQRGVFYNTLYKALKDGDKELYAKIEADLYDNGVKPSDIKSAMKSRYEKDADAGAGFLKNAKDIAGIRFSEESKTNNFTKSDLDNKQAVEFDNKADDIMDDIEADFNANGFAKLSKEEQNKLLNDAIKYAEATALEQASGGQNSNNVAWIEAASEGAFGLDVGEYIMLKNEYSAQSLLSDNAYKAYDADIDIELYLAIRDAVDEIEGKGKKDKIEDELEKHDFTNEQMDVWADIFGYKNWD